MRNHDACCLLLSCRVCMYLVRFLDFFLDAGVIRRQIVNFVVLHYDGRPSNSLILFFVCLFFSAQISDGCLPEPYRRQNRARSFSSTTRTNEIGKIFTLNHGEVSAVRPNLSTRRGQTIYGR